MKRLAIFVGSFLAGMFLMAKVDEYMLKLQQQINDSTPPVHYDSVYHNGRIYLDTSLIKNFGTMPEAEGLSKEEYIYAMRQWLDIIELETMQTV